LDVFGPVELFSMVPDRLAIEFIGPEAGPVASSHGVQVTATIGYDGAATPDIVLIPGGRGTRRLVNDRGAEPLRYLGQRWVFDVQARGLVLRDMPVRAGQLGLMTRLK
jgi:putative intracellular protease/amidase